MSEVSLSLTINGVRRDCAAAPNTVLADLLREEFGLTGCKVACDQGVCGACTVLVNDTPVTGCSTFAFQVDGASITTIEGLAKDGLLHAVQRAFLSRGAYQCGFCTSGMILSIATLLERVPDPDEAAVRDWLSGNICRCTGYRAILESVTAAVLDRAMDVA